MSTFSTDLYTITFQDDAGGWRENPDSDVSTRGFPGGDGYAISIGGQRATTRSVSMLLESKSDYDTLARMRAKRGLLHVDGWDTAEVRVVLKSLSPDPLLPDGQLMVRAEFVFEP